MLPGGWWVAEGCVVVPHHTLDSHLVRAASLLAKSLPMEQFQVIQDFIHMVPQGRKMVEEVSEGLGQYSADSG